MTPEHFRQLISELTYKPGTTFELREEHNSLWVFTIVIRAPDCNEVHKGIVPVEHGVTLKDGMFEQLRDEAHALEWIRDRVNELEQHEIDEWLRHQGRNVRRPHHPFSGKSLFP